MTNDDHTDLTAGKDIPPWLQPVPDGEEEALEASTRRKRLIFTTTAAVIVIGLFVAVIFYLYDSSEPVAPRHIAAPTEPVRTRPDDMGGMQVDHQDKEVFNQTEGGQVRSEVRLGEQPEEPLDALPDEQEAIATEVDDAIDQVLGAADATKAKAPVAEPVKEPVEKTLAEEKIVAPIVKKQTPMDTIYRVQLGAYGSEESAERAWRGVKGKFPTHMADKLASFEPVQSGSRTLYRLRVGPLVTRAEADEVCLALRAGQQACIVVNP